VGKSEVHVGEEVRSSPGGRTLGGFTVKRHKGEQRRKTNARAVGVKEGGGGGGGLEKQMGEKGGIRGSNQ